MISLYDILNAANGQLFGEPGAQLFTGFSLDPRAVGPSILFISQRNDPGDAIAEAIRNGAGGLLVTAPPDLDTTGVSVLMVNDTIEALFRWTHFALGKLGVRVIAVSGSDGKSMAAHAITRVLSQHYHVHPGNIDGHGALSIPLSLATLKPEHDMVVFKLDAHMPGDMARMVEATRPAVAVILHIDPIPPAGFEDIEQYVHEQTLLLESLDGNGLCVVNFDDDYAHQALSARRKNEGFVLTVGIDRFGADIMAFNMLVGAQRIGFDLRFGSERFLGRWMPVLGRHHLYGGLAALAVGTYLDVPIEDSLKTLTGVKSLPGRMNPLSGWNDTLLIDDTYRAGTQSSLYALEWLENARVEGQRTIFILGDMDNLGKNSTYGHRIVGIRAATTTDLFITQGIESAQAARSAIDHGRMASAIRITYSPQDVMSVLREFGLRQDDIILVKGGVNAGMEAVVRELLSNSDDARYLVRQNGGRVQHGLRTVRPSWLEVDATALAHNVRTIRAGLPDEVTLMAVVKANGYGHGAILAARTALLNGATYLAVASIAEAAELRDAGIDVPILVLSYLPAEVARQAVELKLTVTIFDLEMARAYDRAARDLGQTITCHVKVDTGMGRLGVMPDEVVRFFRYLSALRHVNIEGIYTHLSSADEDIEHTETQITTFRELLRPLRAGGFTFKYVHAANSAGVLRSQSYYFNMVRPGLLLYGLSPTEDLPLPEAMRPVLSWKTTVLQVKTLPPGHPVGYGNTYRTRTQETIAILPVGYAEGLRRSPQTWRHVLIHGQRAPLIGRVSMEKCAVSVARIEGVQAGDEVVLIGQQDDASITIDEVARWLGTVNYEVVTMLSATIPRVIRYS